MLNVEGPVTIYIDTRKALRLLRIRCLCLAPIFLIMFAVFSRQPLPLDGFNNLLRWILLAEIPILYFLISINLTKQTKPIVSFSSLGITVNTIGNRIGFLRWNEIKEIYTYNLMYRFVGIELKDPKTVYARLGLKGSWLLRLNDLCIPMYKLFRIPVSPINIPQDYLPISADELLAQIEAYRTTYSYTLRP